MEIPTIILGGHFGNGIQIVSSGLYHTIQYGYIDMVDNSMEIKLKIEDISKKDMIELAKFLLVLALEK